MTLLKAAEIRKYEPLLIYSKDELPANIFCHRQCYQTFTIKKELEQIQLKAKQKQDELETLLDQVTEYSIEISSNTSNKERRTSSSSLGILLPRCLFCDKEIKYKKRKPKKLKKYCEKRVQETIKNAANEINDYSMISLLSTTDLIAAEAMYHRSCYVDYTRNLYNTNQNPCITVAVMLTNQKPSSEKNAYQKIELQAFKHIVEECFGIISEPRIVALMDLKTIMEEQFHNHGINISLATKKKLRRNLEKTFNAEELKFTNIQGKTYLYPSTLTVEMVIKVLVLEDNSMADKVLEKAAKSICKEELTDDTPWPPQPDDL